MSDSDLLSPFLTRLDVKAKRPDEPLESTGTEDDELAAPGDAYATVTGQRVAYSIEFIPRDDDPVVIPYGYLPLLWPKRSGFLLIEYPTLFTVRLEGKKTDIVKRLIRDRRITCIRECSETEAAALPVAITRIEFLRLYPSRETGVDPPRGE